MVSILWICIPQMWGKKWFGRTKNATFSTNFLYLNIYSTLFTTINNDISIYTYVNEIKNTIHLRKCDRGVNAHGVLYVICNCVKIHSYG